MTPAQPLPQWSLGLEDHLRALNPVNSIAERASASLGSRYRPGATRYNQLFVTLFPSTSSCPSLFPSCPRYLLFCVELQRAWLFALEHSLGFTCHQPCHSPASPPHLPASPPSAKQPPQPSPIILSFKHYSSAPAASCAKQFCFHLSHGPLSIIRTCPLLPYLCSLRLRRESLLSNRNHVAKQ